MWVYCENAAEGVIHNAMIGNCCGGNDSFIIYHADSSQPYTHPARIRLFECRKYTKVSQRPVAVALDERAHTRGEVLTDV